METIMTPTFRVSWPEVFEAKSFKEGEAKFSVVMLFNKEDIRKDKEQTKLWKAMKILHDETEKQRWPKGPPKDNNNPFRDGMDKEDSPGYGENIIFVKAISKFKPAVVDQNVEDIINREDFYPGCYARAKVNVYSYDMAGNRGVGFGLKNIQKIAEGEPLGGRSNPSDDFNAIASVANGPDNEDDLFG